MKKILVVCGNGLGSSFIVEMNVKKALEELGLEAEVDHTDLSTSKNEQADLYIGAADIIDQLNDGTRNVAGLNNLLDQKAIKDVLRQHI
ncbi:PTS sugar transporter subunit IIB [Bacillus safensis]|uniref:PTS sugar transporter subunit IIB n=1 Tax=Bacillus TaxID=1386 RepID=UPI000BD87471|nr:MULTISPECIES: PTS sugar transporter subunit IIB [Bacillus]MBW4851060.1 PTS sugar transporter subunit IIB [Bacillaceae bacterium]MBU5208034.1 PTS sugar transporter subunit IIB [Bacillus safensis]MBW4851649.1 PTS sugar transporter subunit IIB [Bacillaceae bacterium]MBW4856048.1 PTS sugar transporter subunit IIB [Bacillaceae bacterium]MCK1972040.1 PTS sugar transporter subunit IIB [Bacillus safensis]